MPASPGAWIIVRDTPDKCEAPGLSPAQKDQCRAESGGVMLAILLGFVAVVIATFVWPRSKP